MKTDVQSQKSSGNLFSVTRRATQKVDLVYQSKNGSIASISPYYASCGMIGKVILAVYQVIIIITL